METPAEIFIVDDDPTMRDALGPRFELEGYNVSTFADGESFLLAARKGSPASILRDIGMQGDRASAFSRSSPRRAIVFRFSSSRGTGIFRLQLRQSRKAFDFIEPFDGDAVVKRVREAIAGQSGERPRK